MTPLEIVGTVFIAYGGFTMLMGAIGVVRFPDFYTRLHAAGKGDTLGQGLVLLGLIFVTGVSIDGLKLVLIVFFIFILNSSATHALARAGWFAGIRPWTPDAEPGTTGLEGQLTPTERDALFVPIRTGGATEAPATDDAPTDAARPEDEAPTEGEDA